MSENFLDLMTRRHCKRAYLDKPVTKEIITRVLEVAGNAASSKNTQPWRVEVVSGISQQVLSKTILEKFDKGINEKADYPYHPDPMPEEFTARARECGYALFALKGIGREDRAKRVEHSRQNFLFFGAPLVLIFHLPRGSGYGNFLDMGLFMQNVMLGFLSFGIDGCPQASLTGFSDTIRAHCGLGEDRLIVAGLSLGYAKEEALVNTFIPKRLPVNDFTQWHA